jgi:hypothetical protein
MKGTSMKATQQPTYPFLFAARTFAADTQSEKLVLYHLIARIRDGVCFPKQDAIAYAEQLDPRSIKRAIAALKTKGVITIEKKGRNNVYRLHLAAIEKRKLPPMPEAEEATEPPTTKNVLIHGRRVGKGTPVSPITEIGDICVVNRGHQTTCKKTVKKTSKTKKTVSSTQITQCNDERNFFSGNQEPVPQASAVPQPATQIPNAEVLTLQENCQGTPTSPIEKPRITLHEAKRQVEREAWQGNPLVCTRCWRVGAFDASMGEGCQSYGDDGVSCGGVGLSADQWLAQLEAQWETYNKQVAASTGVSVKEIVGRLDFLSMEKQQEIISYRAAAETKTVAERRECAKKFFDSENRWKIRKAWYLYASGMLDDDAEAQPWEAQLFADLEALQPREEGTE